jgi:hypothetical protein
MEGFAQREREPKTEKPLGLGDQFPLMDSLSPTFSR